MKTGTKSRQSTDQNRIQNRGGRDKKRNKNEHAIRVSRESQNEYDQHTVRDELTENQVHRPITHDEKHNGKQVSTH